MEWGIVGIHLQVKMWGSRKACLAAHRNLITLVHDITLCNENTSEVCV